MTQDILRDKVDQILIQYPTANCSIFAKSMATGEVFAIRETEQYPAASVIKLCVLIELIRQAHAGKFKLDDPITVTQDTGGERGSGILKHLRMPLSLSAYNLATLMIIYSDNTASNRCIDLVGFDNVNSTLAKLGTKGTVLRRYFIGAAVDNPLADNMITTMDLGLLLEKMHRKELVSAGASDQMLTILKKQQHNERIPGHLPQNTVVAHKTGTQPRTAHDAGIVYPGNGKDYVVSIVVTGVPARPIGSTMIADLSAVIYDHMSAVELPPSQPNGASQRI
jgi:beta-lactamase class A